MIVVAVASIIAAVAIPNYQEQSKNGRRAAAAAALIDATSRQEQFFLDNKTYTTTIIAGGLNMAPVTKGGTYALSVDAPTAACQVNRCFRVRATPRGAQIGDKCGAMTINSDRIKTPIGCW
jgi:type IV pilus assembly protein PilE